MIFRIKEHPRYAFIGNRIEEIQDDEDADDDIPEGIVVKKKKPHFTFT